MLADYGNKASMEAYGYKKFTESDYWPIKSAKEGLHSNIEKGGNSTAPLRTSAWQRPRCPTRATPWTWRASSPPLPTTPPT
ncbi:MAG: hypothetical protein V8R55_11890 [Dysosmobacter sp.]